jgi:hypothetical protein
MAFSHPAPHWSHDSLADTWRTLRVTWRTLGGPLAYTWHPLGVSRSPCHVVRDGNLLILEIILPTGEAGMAWVAILLPPPPPLREFWFLPLSPYLNDFCPIFLLLFLPLDTALFYVNAAIMGWLLFSCSALKAVSAAHRRYMDNSFITYQPVFR